MTNTTNGWEELLKPELDEWKAQGRSEEQVYGVINFLTGRGGFGIKRLLETARRERDAEIKDIIDGMIAVEMLRANHAGKETSRLTSLATEIRKFLTPPSSPQE